jgi:hypothetical protein
MLNLNNQVKTTSVASSAVEEEHARKLCENYREKVLHHRCEHGCVRRVALHRFPAQQYFPN